MAPVNVRLNILGVLGCAFAFICMWCYLFGLPFSTREVPRVSMKELLSVSIELARRGGEKVKTIRGETSLEQKVKGKTKEGAKELYTQGDMESHRAIFYGMLKEYPGLSIVSEEHDNIPRSLEREKDVNKQLEEVMKVIQSDQQIPIADITVWIDPLDATQEYTENLTKFVTTMVCVAVKGEPTIGVINFPFNQETVWAWVGYGHSENLKKSPKKDVSKNPKIIVSRSHQGDVTEVAEETFGKDSTVIPAGGAGYKTVSVIRGEADVYVHTTLIKKWDICAGNAILSALDSKMTDLNGNTIDYSDHGDRAIQHGLLATLYNHDYYLDKLKPLTQDKHKEKGA